PRSSQYLRCRCFAHRRPTERSPHSGQQCSLLPGRSLLIRLPCRRLHHFDRESPDHLFLPEPLEALGMAAEVGTLDSSTYCIAGNPNSCRTSVGVSPTHVVCVANLSRIL